MNRRQLIIDYAAATLLAGLTMTNKLKFDLSQPEFTNVQTIYRRLEAVSKAANYEARFSAGNTFFETDMLRGLRERLQPLNFGIPRDGKARILKAVMIRDLLMINMSGMSEDGDASAEYLEGMSLKSAGIEYEIHSATAYFAQAEKIDAFCVLVFELKIIRESPEHKFLRTSQGQASKSALS